MALLPSVLLRYLSHLSKWGHSFTRLFTVTRAVLWRKIDILELSPGYGTAGGHCRHLAIPNRPFVQALESYGQHIGQIVRAKGVTILKMPLS